MDNRNKRNNKRGNNRRESRFDSKAVSIRRVAKSTSGGKRLRFSAMVVVGDKKGNVGVALGQGVDTRSAIEKGARKAEKHAKKIQLVGDTIPHELEFKKGAARIMLRPAKPGTGVIAGSSVRTVLELCGIENVYGKILGTNDVIANTYATFEALTSLRSGRVLRKMTKMKDRIALKQTMDKERKAREARLWKARKAEEAKNGGKNDKYGKGRNNRRGGKPKFNAPKDNAKPAVNADAKPADKPVEKKAEVKAEPKKDAKPAVVKAEVKVDAKPAEKKVEVKT